MTVSAPPGWPHGLPPPESPGFDAKVVGWLLDQCPPEYRLSDTLRAHPVALARLAVCQVEASLAGARQAYAGVRRDLRDYLDPDQIDAVLLALEHEGSRLVGLAREVAMVEEALRGRRWRPRL